MRRPGYQPLDKVGLSKALGLPPDFRKQLRDFLDSLERTGEICRIRDDRYVLPAIADLVTGKLEVHRNGSAHVLSGVRGKPDVFIDAQHTGTAMHGDQVVVQLDRGGRVVRPRPGNRVEGRVIRILSRNTDIVVGTLQKSRQELLHVIPDDPRFPHSVYVKPGDARLPQPPRVGDKVVVRLAPWENRVENPEGEIIEVLGPAFAPGVDMIGILRKYDLRPEFPVEVVREAERIPERLTERDLHGREDLRGQPAITIDPDDARDFDDAIHVERLRSGGGWRLSVHIADVSHYVQPKTALDKEAQQRGNSTYLVDRVIPMLPERLSNGICSLKPGVDRLAFSAFIDFTADGRIKSARFAKTVINSKARLSYRQAFAILNGAKTMPPLPAALTREEVRGQATLAEGPHVPVDPAIAERVQAAWELASVLRRNRFANGSLDLDFPEVKIWLDAEGRAARMEKVENDASHQLIEECMLAANEVVAREIKNRLVPAVYRIHENPDPDRLNEFRDFAAGYGFRAGDLTNRDEVRKILAAIRGSAEEYAIKLQFLKSLKRAVYDVKPLGHYGLAKVNYTHFTSPIRRYADLLVHRSLEQVLTGGGKKKAPPTAENMATLAEHISQTERTSAEAERDSVTIKKVEFFQRQIASKKPQEFQAIVVDVRSFGLFVELPEIMTSGMVHVSSLPEDFYLFDATKLCFTGRRTKRRYKVGDRMSVVVSRVDAQKRQIDFAPVAGSEVHSPDGVAQGKPRPPHEPAERGRRHSPGSVFKGKPSSGKARRGESGSRKRSRK
jgi:ribonuclease R